MSKVARAIRDHHKELIGTLTRHVAALAEGQPEAQPKAFASFLKDDLLPHAKGEEQHLYPLVDGLIKSHGSATATMSVDHEFIEGYIRDIAEAAEALGRATAKERPNMERRLQRMAIELAAVLRVHLEKEERVYLPLFEQYLSEIEQQQVLDGMHGAYGPGAAGS